MLTVRGLHLHTLHGLIPEVHMGHVIEDKKLSSPPLPTCAHLFHEVSLFYQASLTSIESSCIMKTLIMLEAIGYHRQTQKAEESTASFSSRESP